MFKSLLSRIKQRIPQPKEHEHARVVEPWETIAPEDENRFYRLAVCLIFKNEADYLKEWVEFHRLVGVEKFFLYNNNSDDDYKRVLAPYVAEGLVTLYDFPIHPPAAQAAAYNACLNVYRSHARWIAFIDIDEFLYPREGDSLLDILSDYEEFPAVAVNWLMFSTSGHVLRPKGLVIRNYTRCQAGANKHVRLIVNPAMTERVYNAHEAQFLEGRCAVNEQRCEIRGPYSEPPSILRLCINHYWTRSVEEFSKKVSRGDVAGLTELRNMEGLIKAERRYSGAEDHSIQRFAARMSMK